MEQQPENKTTQDAAPATGERVDENRRQLSRGALAATAVLFSLGNRPAWSVSPDCISANTAASWAAGTHASHHPDADYSGHVLNPGTGEYCPRARNEIM